MRKPALVLSVLLLTLPLSGCWDRKEISELSLVMAKGIDLSDDGKVRVCVQVAIPSKVGGSQSGSGKGEGGQSFFVVSGIGRTVSEADARIQEELPRQLYLPHLRIVLVGDKMARSGVDKILDHFGRNPPNRFRTAFLIAKDGDALSYLNTTYPLESLSGEAVRKLERQLIGRNTTLLDFLIQASTEGQDQFTSAISLRPQDQQESSSGPRDDNQYFGFYNQAIFRDLKLVGYLDTPKSIALQWINNHIRFVTLTMQVPKTNGTISVEITQAHSRGRTFVQGNRVGVRYELTGSSMLTENTTGLDADDPKVIQSFQGALNAYITQTTKACLHTLCTEMDADPEGIGEMVYHQHPYAWERLKGQWRKMLPNVKYEVISKVKIVEGGKSGPPLYGKPQRGILTRKPASEALGESER